MSVRQPILVSEPWEVRQELRALGLTEEFVLRVARACAAAKVDALEIDPCSTPGTLAYIAGVRHIRLQLLPDGWVLSRSGNVESTVNHELGIQLCFQNVDQACADQDPQAISGKGAGSRKLIADGQGNLFDSPPVQSQLKPTRLGSIPTVWILCVSIGPKRLCAEVSCPEVFEGEQFDGFSKRILVVDEDLNPTPAPEDKERPDAGDDADFEVRISKK